MSSFMSLQKSLLPPLALLLSAGFASGCGSLWGTYSTPDPENCVRNSNVCKSGEHCNMQTQACEPTDLTPVDPFPPPAAPTTFLSPGGLSQTLAFARDVRFVMASAKPATIHYTLNGTPPTPGGPSTMSGQNILQVGPLPTATTLTWFGDYGPSFDMETARVFTTNTDASLQSGAGSISEGVQFAIDTGLSVTYNLGPVVIMPRSAHVFLRINFQAWAATSGSGKLQYVVSGEGVGVVGCLDNVQDFGPYPGRSLALFVNFNTPFLPGHYKLVAGLNSAPSCDHSPTTGPEIAQIFVQ